MWVVERSDGLTAAMSQAWGDVAAAVECGRVDAARALADDAFTASGRDRECWTRYPRLFSLVGVDVRTCEGLPRGWAYHFDTGVWHQLLLIHPDACAFVTPVGFGPLMQAARQAGSGLVEMDQLLSAVLLHEIQAPEDASGL